MAEISYSCDVAQGFNAQSDAQSIVGFLTDLKIGDTQFAIDLNVTDPEDVESELAVVGVISDIYWNGGEAEPIQISCRVSTQNKNGAIELVQRTLLNTSVGFSFVIYEYDPQAKKYFPCFHTGGETYEGLVLKEGGELAIQVDSTQSPEVPAPKIFPFSLGIMPPDVTEGQPLHFAASVDKKMVKQWGVKVTA